MLKNKYSMWTRHYIVQSIITAINALGVVSTAPHPNAVKLFNDFVISKEGAKVYRSVCRIPPQFGRTAAICQRSQSLHGCSR